MQCLEYFGWEEYFAMINVKPIQSVSLDDDDGEMIYP